MAAMMIPYGITDPDTVTNEQIIAAALADGETREEAEAILAAIRGELGDYVE